MCGLSSMEVTNYSRWGTLRLQSRRFSQYALMPWYDQKASYYTSVSDFPCRADVIQLIAVVHHSYSTTPCQSWLSWYSMQIHAWVCGCACGMTRKLFCLTSTDIWIFPINISWELSCYFFPLCSYATRVWSVIATPDHAGFSDRAVVMSPNPFLGFESIPNH